MQNIKYLPRTVKENRAQPCALVRAVAFLA
jgi:hypothetical protein